MVLAVIMLFTMLSPEWAKEHFHTAYPFMRECVKDKTGIKGEEGRYVRFWREEFRFGKRTVYVSKEWFERQRPFFDTHISREAADPRYYDLAL